MATNLLKKNDLSKSVGIMCLILLISPFLFIVLCPFFQLYLFHFKKINIRLLLATNFFISLFWYFCFHYYLGLLISNHYLEKFNVEVLTLTDSWILTTLIDYSLTVESIFRSLFIETALLLHVVGQNLNITIVISNIF
jgi:hypothetical protein